MTGTRNVAGVAIGVTLAVLVAARPAVATTGPQVSLSDGVLTVLGDAASNTIVVGRDTAGAITVNGSTVVVHGHPTAIANVHLIAIRGQGGGDAIALDEANGPLPAAWMDGGSGDDVLIGGSGDDTLAGGDGNDRVAGRRGDDVGRLGAGNDSFLWEPGDGSDVVEGGTGPDTMRINGSTVDENVSISTDGSRVRFARDVAHVTVDLTEVERIDFRGSGGADHVTVDDLSGTGVTQVNLDLAGAGQPGSVTVNGTTGDDTLTVAGSTPAGVTVSGPHTVVGVTGTDGPGDGLTLNTLGGDDVVDATPLAAGTVTLTVDGGDGDDVLLGSPGDDIIFGGGGDDVLIGGAGSDQLDGGPGDNVVIQ
jgi:Ca2+-binding RTX toxin-like protein